VKEFRMAVDYGEHGKPFVYKELRELKKRVEELEKQVKELQGEHDSGLPIPGLRRF